MASGGCYCVPSVSTNGGSPLAAMELALAPAPHSLCVGVEVLWELLHISPTGLLLRSNLILEPLEEATYEQPASSSTKEGPFPPQPLARVGPSGDSFDPAQGPDAMVLSYEGATSSSKGLPAGPIPPTSGPSITLIAFGLSDASLGASSVQQPWEKVEATAAYC
ncbi:hypothetical protein BHM03_00061374 [Ensete ventricosum]|nr:hypothetical protein BHM03_00061374 [Ensete ventricosum]